MSICDQCASGDHSYHKAELDGGCDGCACEAAWCPDDRDELATLRRERDDAHKALAEEIRRTNAAREEAARYRDRRIADEASRDRATERCAAAERERDEARAELDAARAVVEAARRYRNAQRCDLAFGNQVPVECVHAVGRTYGELEDALANYDARKNGGG